jgi:hypothetical protein
VLIRKAKALYREAVPAKLQQKLKPALHPLLTILRSHTLSHASGAVISGPFQGMQFGREPLSLPIVLGTYELELHEVINRLNDKNFMHFIDVGAAEGYYAVGVALLNPECSVIAYEAQPKYHDSIANLAQLNGVTERIRIKDTCSPSKLADDLRMLAGQLSRTLIIVDVEGYEKDLLDPDQIPGLSQATILVEVHDNFVPGCGDAIRHRFAHTHFITEFVSRDREWHEYPVNSWIRKQWFMRGAVVHTISDGRTAANGWMLLEPKT